ncbi:DUF2463 domain-containing protein [Encephalitozoon hellem]|nr:DUF2463 domain-containing protein [Encephalitozoon hellem]
MNKAINVALAYPDSDPLESKEEVNTLEVSMMQLLISILSMMFPIALYSLSEILIKNGKPLLNIEENMPLRFLMATPSCLYSGILHFISFNNYRKEQYESQSGFYSLLYFILGTIFLLFSTTSLFSIFMLSIEEWNSKKVFSLVLLPSLVVYTSLLYTSCDLTQAGFRFTATGTIDMLFDFSIFLCISISIAIIILQKGNDWEIYFSIISVVFALVRLFKQRYFPSMKYEGPTPKWRRIIPIIVLVIGIAIYGILGTLNFLLFHRYFFVNDQ